MIFIYTYWIRVFLRTFITRSIVALVVCVSVTQGVIFECRFTVQFWPFVGDLYQCEATVDVFSSDNSLESVSGRVVMVILCYNVTDFRSDFQSPPAKQF